MAEVLKPSVHFLISYYTLYSDLTIYFTATSWLAFKLLARVYYLVHAQDLEFSFVYRALLSVIVDRVFVYLPFSRAHRWSVKLACVKLGNSRVVT